MAIMDAKLELSDAQSLTTSTTAGNEIQSSNLIDLGAANLQIGAGVPLMLNVRVNTAFSGTGPRTFQAKLMTNTDSTLTDGTTIIATDAIAISANLNSAGTWILRQSIPYEALQRYLGLVYVLAADVTNMTTGAVDAWISLDSQSSYGISAEI